ncbi:TetR family transcriptional regulator [Hoeflea sp.]|uniref:TetR family transcriptional regulator n=1 Tax=Hoeflea sp. TaxID=1940281 RepID=UPI0025C4786C|nr:TetR family transcriptional regulator [Hoeflea sp.]
MARPQPDADARRQALLAAAERVLKANRGRRLVMSDVAAEAGMSQSYAYRFFSDKNALIAAMAENWFADVSKAVCALVDGPGPVRFRLEDFVLVQMRMKCAGHDADPVLFSAYLDLASGHPDIVMAHVQEMERVLTALMAERFPGRDAAAAARVFNDATRMFRDPYVIARMRPLITEDRARAVIATVLAGLESGQPA